MNLSFKNRIKKSFAIFNFLALFLLTSTGFINCSKTDSGTAVNTNETASTQNTDSNSGAQNRVSVMDYGAVANGTVNDADSIQKALNYVHQLGGGTVLVPPGTYLLKKTLIMYKHTSLVGEGFGRSIFYRTGNYGNTLEVGLNVSGEGAQDCVISGIWFNHAHSYQGGSNVTNLDNPVSPGYAHIAVRDGQDVRIYDNWIWNLSFGIYVDGGAKISIKNNNILGIYDPKRVNIQEGFASIALFKNSTNGGIATGIAIENNYIAGTFSEDRLINWGAGNLIKNHDNIGPLHGIYIECIESGQITNNYIGANSDSGIEFAPKTIAAGVSISNNYFDGATSTQISFKYNGSYATNITVTGNNFFAAQVNGSAIIANYSGINPSVTNLIVHGNTFRDHVKSPIKLLGAIGFNITGNTFLNYNSYGLSFGDPDYASGIFLIGGAPFGVTRNGTVSSNTFGGGGMYSTSNSTDNFAVWGIYTAGNGVTGVNLTGNSGVFRTGGGLAGGDLIQH